MIRKKIRDKLPLFKKLGEGSLTPLLLSFLSKNIFLVHFFCFALSSCLCKFTFVFTLIHKTHPKLFFAAKLAFDLSENICLPSWKYFFLLNREKRRTSLLKFKCISWELSEETMMIHGFIRVVLLQEDGQWLLLRNIIQSFLMKVLLGRKEKMRKMKKIAHYLLT